MWLFTSKGFVSVVASRDSQDDLIVRARVRGHLEALFPDATQVETTNSDYRHRATLSNKIVEQVVADQISAINYPNFKDTVVDPDYHAACLRVWSVMHYLQK
jgi:hypothetical protein